MEGPMKGTQADERNSEHGKTGQSGHGAGGAAPMPTVYKEPEDGLANPAALLTCERTFAERICTVATPTGCDAHPGLIVVLDGRRIVRRIGRLVESGQVKPANLPIMVGIDPDEWLRDYTPWWHPAYRTEAPDFGGGADAFIEQVLLPVAQDAYRELARSGPRMVLGYSLATLAMLECLIAGGDAFDTYLIASPSTWYPGFVNKVARTPLACAANARVVIACGEDEGEGEPEPICGIRQDTDRLVEALASKLATPPELILDDRDHHGGFALRLRALLERV